MFKAPILFILLLSFSFTFFGQTEKNIAIDTTSIPFAIIEKPPIYPGCNNPNNNAIKKCTSERVQAFVSANFNLKIIDSLDISSNSHRISVQFKINTSGNAVDVNVSAVHPLIKQEAIRVVKSLPKFTPGEQKRELVSTLYVIPIQIDTTSKND